MTKGSGVIVDVTVGAKTRVAVGLDWMMKMWKDKWTIMDRSILSMKLLFWLQIIVILHHIEA